MAKGAFIGVPTRINTLKILDYIESSGTQHIDTKYKATSENFRIKCKFTVLDYGANTVLFGGGGSTDIISVLLTNDNQFKFYVGSGSVSGLSYTLVYDTEYEMECYANNGTITVTLNGETKSGRYSGEINKDYPMFIFANNASGTANQKSSIRVSEFQIYDNNTLVRDYVSCRNVDDEIGLYNRANSEFYPNAGTGTFIAGSVVEEVGGEVVEVAREVKQMFIGVDGIARKVKKAWVGVNGVARLFFSSSLPLSNLPVGALVKVNVSGVATNFMVVHQGLPSSIYDSSCDGVWLLRQDLYETQIRWNTQSDKNSANNNYTSSNVHSVLNSTIYNEFDSGVRSIIKQVKIPYGYNSVVYSGSNGLSTKLFLLSCGEVGLPASDTPSRYSQYMLADGACLSYFNGIKNANTKRIAYRNGTASRWWLRSVCTSATYAFFISDTDGSPMDYNTTFSTKIYTRPAFILPSETLVNPTPNADGSYTLLV